MYNNLTISKINKLVIVNAHGLYSIDEIAGWANLTIYTLTSDYYPVIGSGIISTLINESTSEEGFWLQLKYTASGDTVESGSISIRRNTSTAGKCINGSGSFSYFTS